ncbi:serine hydrolase [Kribbella shirazensis]|uniref:CubicO group peptidase (Beta-lactamase class C family) n=1 Tax=Kribbella shirazensis TaxID=1105143 RepID=A0A7X6A2H7_9ACTN|nr:CubicO group peptidase (beta-lactamase class C family) [Kribbella shirazensis]
MLAARIIEEKTGLPYEQALQTELFGPCGMTDATVEAPRADDRVSASFRSSTP